MFGSTINRSRLGSQLFISTFFRPPFFPLRRAAIAFAPPLALPPREPIADKYFWIAVFRFRFI
jgi:hypothetical protein